MYMNRYGMLGVVVSVVALLVAGTVIPNAYAQEQDSTVARYTGGFFLYKNYEDFFHQLEAKVPEVAKEAGFTDEEVNMIKAEIAKMIKGKEEIINNYRYFIFGISKGSFYLFGCFLPQEPPLNLGQQIQCGVLYMSMGTPDPANDLHVHIHSPYHSTLLDIPSPGLPDPFLWISDPITLDQVGTWNIVADFTRDGAIILTLDVTFQVIPESIIGVAGIVAGPLAVLAYKLRKKSNQ